MSLYALCASADSAEKIKAAKHETVMSTVAATAVYWDCFLRQERQSELALKRFCNRSSACASSQTTTDKKHKGCADKLANMDVSQVI